VKSILITDDCDHLLIDGLIKLGYKVDYHPEITSEKVDEIIHSYFGIVVNTKIKMDKHRIDLTKNLSFICRLGSGLDHFDLDYCAEKNIAVISSPEGNRQAVAEHVLGMVLALMIKLREGYDQIYQQTWNREAVRGTELSGKKIGIIGFGNNGSAFADILSGFDVELFIYDKYKTVESGSFGNSTRISCTLDEILENVSIISFHIPLTHETNGMINDSFIARCRPGTILINTSRGRISDLDAIIKGLQTKQLGGTCLDVFPNEKVSTFSPEEKAQINYLCAQKNVVLTPHVAGWTIESKVKIAKILLDRVAHLKF